MAESKQTELLLFHSNHKTLDNNISIKIQRKIIIPSQNVKYLGLHIDDRLSWDFHIKQLAVKLSWANGILSKLRYYAPKETLIQVYNSIFYSHVLYGCPSWSLTSMKNLNTISVLQNKCLRIMNFAPFRSSTNELFKNDSILKVCDILDIEKRKVAFDFNCLRIWWLYSLSIVKCILMIIERKVRNISNITQKATIFYGNAQRIVEYCGGHSSCDR